MRKLGLVLVLVALIAAIPAMADQGDKIIRFGIAYVSPSGDYHDSYTDGPYFEEWKVEADAAIGPYFGFEFMLTDLIGIDGTVLYTDHDINERYLETFEGEVVFDECMEIGSISTMPIFISAHFHVIQKDAIDWYVGPSIAYIFNGDLDFNPEFETGSIPIKNEFGYGFVTGIDVPFGAGGWNFSTALRYIMSDAEAEDNMGPDGEAIGIDPLILHVGVGKRW